MPRGEGYESPAPTVFGEVSQAHAIFSIGLVPLTFGLAFGFAFGNVGGAMSCTAFGEYYGQPDTSTQQLIAAMLPMGAIVGSIVGGTIADHFGRSNASVISATLFVIGCIVLGLPLWGVRSIAPLLIGRAKIGGGAGIAFMSVPAYVCELSASSYRGAMASSISLSIALGFFCSYIFNWFVLTDYSDGWKWAMLIPLFPSLLFLAASFCLPRSPRWILLKDLSLERATDILKRLRTPQDDVTKEVQEIIQDVESSRTVSTSSLWSPIHRFAVLVSITIMMLQVATGIDIILVYAPQNFSKVLVSETSNLFWTTFIGAMLVFSNCIACFIVDRVGRRALLLFGSIGMTLSLLASALAYHLHFKSTGEDLGKGSKLTGVACVVASMAYVTFFSLSWGPVAFCIPSELVPSRIRARVVSLAAVCNWVADYVVVASYLSIVEAIGEVGSCLLYATINAAALLFVFYAVPETMDLSLESASKSLLEDARTTKYRTKST